MTCVFTITDCQRAGEKKPHGFNWTAYLARRWEPDTPYAAGVKVRPAGIQTGLQYSSSGGQSHGRSEPIWPRTAGGTVTDGSITWTAEALSVDSLLEQIDTSTWTVPTGLTGTAEAKITTAGQQAVTIKLAGGAAGQSYAVVNEILTTEGNEYQAVLELGVE